jgi:hypothetical protein
MQTFPGTGWVKQIMFRDYNPELTGLEGGFITEDKLQPVKTEP